MIPGEGGRGEGKTQNFLNLQKLSKLLIPRIESLTSKLIVNTSNYNSELLIWHSTFISGENKKLNAELKI